MTGKTRWITLSIVLAVLASLAAVTARASSLAQEPLGTGFTYQGKLDKDGIPHTGTCDFQFSLWDAAGSGSPPSGGTQVGTTQTETGVTLSEGLFTVELDFDSGAFAGDARWLQIAVRCPAGSGGYTTLGPRQALTAAPYALYASKTSWSGLIGVPAGFADGVDDDTTSWSGLTGVPAGFADGVDDDAAYNRAAPAANAITTVDSGGTIGLYTSVTIGADGLGLVSYYDDTNADLKVLHCGNAACSASNTAITLDSGESVGGYTSIAIGADGLGLISYYDDTYDDLKVAHCSNTACTAATIATLDSTGTVGWNTSIAIGADGLGLISYKDATSGDLKVAHCSNTTCTAATLTTLDSVGTVGGYTSIAIGADGLGLISYYDATNGDLKVAHCSNTTCTAATLTTLDSAGDVGWYTSITIGADGLGLISYHDATNDDLKVAHCSNTTCTAATLTTLDSAGDIGWYTSITIGADGLGLISYHDITNADLKVAHCSNTACTAATRTTLDSAETIGRYTSITIGADGLGLISYYDYTNADLKVAHCSSAFCVPYFRRR
jgi:hypothetical protein